MIQVIYMRVISVVDYYMFQIKLKQNNLKCFNYNIRQVLIKNQVHVLLE